MENDKEEITPSTSSLIGGSLRRKTRKYVIDRRSFRRSRIPATRNKLPKVFLHFLSRFVRSLRPLPFQHFVQDLRLSLTWEWRFARIQLLRHQIVCSENKNGLVNDVLRHMCIQMHRHLLLVKARLRRDCIVLDRSAQAPPRQLSLGLDGRNHRQLQEPSSRMRTVELLLYRRPKRLPTHLIKN